MALKCQNVESYQRLKW